MASRKESESRGTVKKGGKFRTPKKSPAQKRSLSLGEALNRAAGGTRISSSDGSVPF